MSVQEGGEKLSDFLGCLIEDKRGVGRGLERGEIEAEAGLLCEFCFRVMMSGLYIYDMLTMCSGCRI